MKTTFLIVFQVFRINQLQSIQTYYIFFLLCYDMKSSTPRLREGVVFLFYLKTVDILHRF